MCSLTPSMLPKVYGSPSDAALFSALSGHDTESGRMRQSSRTSNKTPIFRSSL